MKPTKNQIFFTAIAFALLLSFRTYAQPSFQVIKSGQHIQNLGNGFYQAGIPTRAIEFLADPEHRGKQLNNMWCWAACIQMALNLYNIPISQQQVVQQVFHSQENSPGGAREVIKALSGTFYDNNGYKFSCSPFSFSLLDLLDQNKEVSRHYYLRTLTLSERIIQELSFGAPIFAGISNPGYNVGHALLMTGANFYVDSNGFINIQTLILRDPAQGYPSRIEMDYSEFIDRHQPDMDFIIRITPYQDVYQVTHRY